MLKTKGGRTYDNKPWMSFFMHMKSYVQNKRRPKIVCMLELVYFLEKTPVKTNVFRNSSPPEPRRATVLFKNKLNYLPYVISK